MKFFPQQWLNQNHNVYFQSLLLFYPASYASLTLGVLQSTTGVIISLAAMLTFKLCPSLSPRAPALHRIPTPICSQRRSRRSSVDSMATDASDITIDSVSTLVGPDIKRKRRLSAASIGKPLMKFAKTTKKEIRPMARRMSDSFIAVSAPFTTSTTSLHTCIAFVLAPRYFQASGSGREESQAQFGGYGDIRSQDSCTLHCGLLRGGCH
ncbi:hypothetical protein CPB85DRAFT_1320104 [Mucidula mucida]|nr:hypothetical protein CPB85DRAFT_1320104 [Mucidula mucida]